MGIENLLYQFNCAIVILLYTFLFAKGGIERGFREKCNDMYLGIIQRIEKGE